MNAQVDISNIRLETKRLILRSWGQGLMPEAVECVISYCFNQLDCDFIQCSHSNFNVQSGRVIENSGFVHIKDIAKSDVEHGKYYKKIYIQRRA